jgi:N utilization substance protein A
VQLDEAQKRTTVYVLKDQLSQAIGKGGRNVRLASKLAGWEIDIYELGGDTSTPASTSTMPADASAKTDAPAESVPAAQEGLQSASAPEGSATAEKEEKKNEG